MRSPPTWDLSSSAVPRAITRPWSITAIWSARRSASSRYCVVSSSVVPPRDQSFDDVPHPDTAARVEAGRRLVEEQHRRLGDQGAGKVEPSPHATGPALDLTVGGLGQVEALEQLVGPLPAGRRAEVVEPAHHVEVLEAGQVLVDRGVLPGDPDAPAQLAGVTDDVEAEHLGRARRRP